MQNLLFKGGEIRNDVIIFFVKYWFSKK